MKRRGIPDSSLELLLDTICNTFGGVLFLAILVCIMLRNTGHSSVHQNTDSQVSEAEVLELVRNQQELETVLEGLRAAVSERDRIAAKFIQPDAKELHNSLERTREDRNKLDAERRKVLADIAEKQASATSIEADIANVDRQLSEARKKTADAETALTSEIASHTVTSVLPREHISTKHQIGFVVRYGRLYQWLRYDRFGNSEGLNTDEFVVIKDENDHVETRPKPFAGTPIESGESQKQLGARFRRFDHQADCLAIAVWDDSFDQFQTVKAAAINAGFEYRLILMREGTSLADRGGDDSRVQ